MRGDIKGQRGEREVCNLLMNWWTPYYPDAVFIRTPGSGGWGGGSKFHQSVKTDMRASGDVMTTLREFPFSVEVKWREKWSMDRVLKGRPSPVWDWWKQAQSQAIKDGLQPMLWFRRNRERWSVFLDLEYASKRVAVVPIHNWSKRELLGVDHGPKVPVLFRASDLLSIDPRILVRSPRAS